MKEGAWKRAMLAAEFLDLLDRGGEIEIVIRHKDATLCSLVEPETDQEHKDIDLVCRRIATRLVLDTLGKRVGQP